MRIYLDTNVPSYAFAPGQEVPAPMVRASRMLMNRIHRGIYEAVLGPAVVFEIDGILERRRRKKIFRGLRRSSVQTLPMDLQIRANQLCDEYLRSGAVPESKRIDALHAAWASLGGAQVLATWNRRSMAKWKARQVVGIVNAAWSLNPLLILRPSEVIGEAPQEDT